MWQHWQGAVWGSSVYLQPEDRQAEIQAMAELTKQREAEEQEDLEATQQKDRGHQELICRDGAPVSDRCHQQVYPHHDSVCQLVSTYADNSLQLFRTHDDRNLG